MQRTAYLALLLCAAPPLAHAQAPLSQADREALIEKLDGLKGNAQEKAMGRISVALAAYKAAMGSDGDAIEFYVKCVEKAEYENLGRSTQDFREWKRHQEERMKRDGLGRALRHQLRWLALTLEAAEAKGNLKDVTPKALAALDDIFSNPEQFADKEPKNDNMELLRKPVTASVFAQAYNIGAPKIEHWPMSPLEIQGFFEGVVFPPLRAEGKLDQLREQWARYARYEGVMHKEFAPPPRTGPDSEDIPDRSEYAKYASDTLPDLKWKTEEDLFKAGDQRRASVNMLALIEANLTHPRAREWADRFRTLVEPPKTTETPKETANKTEP